MHGQQPSLGQRMRRFLALVGALFAVTTAVLVTQRLSDDSLALLLGLGCGAALLMPLVVLLAWMWRRQELRSQEQLRTLTTNAPPVVVVTPALPPGYATQRPALWDGNAAWPPERRERKFTIVGGED